MLVKPSMPGSAAPTLGLGARTAREGTEPSTEPPHPAEGLRTPGKHKEIKYKLNRWGCGGGAELPAPERGPQRSRSQALTWKPGAAVPGEARRTHPEDEVEEDEDGLGGGDAALPHGAAEPRPGPASPQRRRTWPPGRAGSLRWRPLASRGARGRGHLRWRTAPPGSGPALRRRGAAKVLLALPSCQQCNERPLLLVQPLKRLPYSPSTGTKELWTFTSSHWKLHRKPNDILRRPRPRGQWKLPLRGGLMAGLLPQGAEGPWGRQSWAGAGRAWGFREVNIQGILLVWRRNAPAEVRHVVEPHKLGGKCRRWVFWMHPKRKAFSSEE